MYSKEETLATWNKVADRYQAVFMDLDLYNSTYQLFCSYLQSDHPSLLEIGCGPGNISRHLFKLKPNCSLLGIDTSENMIALAQKNIPSGEFKVMDCQYISNLPSTFDGIISGFTLPYLSQEGTYTLFTDCYQKLKPNGILYISFVPGKYKNSGFQSNSQGDRMYFYYHEQAKLKAKLEELNFTILNEVDIPYPKTKDSHEIHRILICMKS